MQKRTQKDSKELKKTQKDTEGHRTQEEQDTEGPRRTQKDPVKASKQRQNGQAAFAHSSFSRWY